MNARTMEED
jgi:DNA-binding HxlR family transcriptional regulator